MYVGFVTIDTASSLCSVSESSPQQHGCQKT